MVRGVTLAAAAIGLAAGNLAMAGWSSASSLDVNAAVTQMNGARAKIGCPSLAVNAALNDSAQGHSAYMASSKNVSRKGSEGSTPASRIADAGYDASSAAELLLTSPASATTADVVNAWLEGSQGKVILNCRLTHVGIGLVSGSNSTSYWTADLARRK